MALRNVLFHSQTYAPDLGNIGACLFPEKKSRSDIRICVTMTSFLGCSGVTGNLKKKVPKDPLFFFNLFFCGVFVGIISISRCADKCYRTSPGEREPPRRQTPQKRIEFFRSTLHVPTGQMVADVLTKSLSYEPFARYSSYLKGVIFPELEKKTKRARLE